MIRARGALEKFQVVTVLTVGYIDLNIITLS